MFFLTLKLKQVPSKISPMSSSDSDNDKRYWGLTRNEIIAYVIVVRVVAILTLALCKKRGPKSTPADLWTFLGILLLPEVYIMWKMFKWATGDQCSPAADMKLLEAQAQSHT
jgi:hypothetical protein